ncbi:hypothetical protein ACB092_08G047400 [Castanea dentata]
MKESRVEHMTGMRRVMLAWSFRECLAGTGVAGIVLPESEEKVMPLPFLLVLLHGGTTRRTLRFTTEFASRAWDLDENFVKDLVGKQSGNGIVQLHGKFKRPEPKKEHREGMALNCEEAPLDVDIKKGGRVVVLNTNNLPLVGEVGLGADLVRLVGSAICSPGFSCDSALQVTYVIRGSGCLQVVGVDGHRVLETTVKAGNLLIVPRFFVVSKIAAPDGMEWFSIITPPQSNIHPLSWKDFSVEGSISSGAPGRI